MNNFSFNTSDDSEDRKKKLIEQLEWDQSVYKDRNGIEFVLLPFNWRYRDEEKKTDTGDDNEILES